MGVDAPDGTHPTAPFHTSKEILMPKSGVDGPTYAGHVNVAPAGAEPEWVKAEDAPAEQPEPAAEPVEAVEEKPEPKRGVRGRR